MCMCMCIYTAFALTCCLLVLDVGMELVEPSGSRSILPGQRRPCHLGFHITADNAWLVNSAPLDVAGMEIVLGFNIPVVQL